MVATWGTGKQDYSQIVEKASALLFRADQEYTVIYSGTLVLNYGDSDSITVTAPSPGYRKILKIIKVSTKENQMIRADFSSPSYKFSEFSYISVLRDLPEGVILEEGETATVTVTHIGDSGVTAEAHITVFGVNEKIIGV